MAKTHFENIKLNAIRNQLFSSLFFEKQLNIFDVITLSSGEYLPTSKMVTGKYKVYGGGGLTEKHHNEFNISHETIGIGRVGARCGCAFKIESKSWVTDNSLYASKINSNYNIDFLIHYLNFIDINQLANTAAQPVISLKRISGISIPIIDLKQQREIVSILDQIKSGNTHFENDGYGIQNILNILDEDELLKSELTHQQSLLKQLRQAFLSEAMQGKLVKQDKKDGNARDLLEQIKAEKAKLIAEKKLRKEKPLPPIKPEEIPFEIPDGWVWCRLGEICSKIGSGSTPKGSNYTKSGILFFRSQNVHDDGLNYEDIKYISDIMHSRMNGTFVNPNDILLNITGGSLGRAALVPKDFTEGNVSQHVCIIRPIKGNSEFFHSLVLSPFFQYLIFGSTTGAGREGLPKYNLEQFLVPLPPLLEQERINQRLRQLMQFCDSLLMNVEQSRERNEKFMQQVLREMLKKKQSNYQKKIV